VPDAVGKTQEAATVAITDAGLVVGTVTQTHSLTVPAGIVISQAPAPDTTALPGTAVDLVVSKGGIAVPDVTGQARGAASAALTTAGLAVGPVTEQYSLAVPAGNVISQSIPAGTPVMPGAEVGLVVSTGGIAVPNVVGQAQSAASAALTGAGLVVGTVTQEYSATVPVGAVLSQMPTAGTLVLPGTPVDLAVSRGVQPSVMPEVAGQARAQAEAAVAGAGLTLGPVTEAHSGTVAAGVVISQSPAAGTELAPGTAISLVVSLGPAPLVEGEGEPVDADTARQALSEAYDAVDTNGDGTLSFGESVAAVPGLTQEVFNELDTDANGELSEDELGMEDGSGCAGCRGGKAALGSSRLSELFLLGLGLLGLAVMAPIRRP
jgi:beta-lactam-binding protein with PASTA domain